MWNESERMIETLLELDKCLKYMWRRLQRKQTVALSKDIVGIL